MNDFSGLTSALLAGRGIGDLPPLVQPELMRNGRLVEVMPLLKYQFPHDDIKVYETKSAEEVMPAIVFH